MGDKQIYLVQSVDREQGRTPGSFAAWNPVWAPKKGTQNLLKTYPKTLLEGLRMGIRKQTRQKGVPASQSPGVRNAI